VGNYTSEKPRFQMKFCHKTDDKYIDEKAGFKALKAGEP
jgi:hypothetical protein